MALRSRLIAPLLGVVAALLLAQYARVWLGTSDQLARTSDFAGTYAASTLWRSGDAAHMYDGATEQRVLAASGAPGDHLDIPFENPPVAALVAAPFALLDAATAYRAWSLLQLLLVVLAVVIAARAAPWPERAPQAVRIALSLVAVAGFGTAALVVEGQWDGPAALGLALAYQAWRHDRELSAGVAIGLTAAIAKPHLAIGLFAFMLGRRDWRAMGGATLGALATVIGGVVVMGAGPFAAFTHALTAPAYSPPLQMQGLTGLFASWLGAGGSVYLASVAISAGAMLVAIPLGARTVRNRGLLEPALAGAATLSLLGAPHLLSHDLVLLAPMLVALLAWIAAAESARGIAWPGAWTVGAIGLWALLSIASQRDLGNAAPAPPGRLTPWPLLLAAAACAVLTLRGASSRWRRPSAVLHVAHPPGPATP